MCTQQSTNDIWFILTVNNNYEITKTGLIRNIYTKKQLTTRKYPDGYIKVGLKKNKITNTQSIHRLLSLNFIDNPNNFKTVDHINNIKDDNRIENLRWANHIMQNNNRQSFKRNNGFKIFKYLDNILIDTYNTQREAAESLNITSTTFSNLIKKKSNFKGFQWYKKEILLVENEIFKSIFLNGKDTGYKISDYGTIINKIGNKTKGSLNNKGYMACSINSISIYVHILVANAFLPNFYNKKIINHKDGNKANCKLYNLEWVTRSENAYHSSNVLKKGCVYINQYDLNKNFIKKFHGITFAARELNITYNGIYDCLRKKSKSYKGFIWERA
jgi:hypothetical protein